MAGQEQMAADLALSPLPRAAAAIGQEQQQQQQQQVLLGGDAPSYSFTFASGLGGGFTWDSDGDGDLERIAESFIARNDDLLDDSRGRDDGQHASLERAGASPEAAAMQPTLTGAEELSVPLPTPRMPSLQGWYGAWHAVPRGSGAIAAAASPGAVAATGSCDEGGAAMPAPPMQLCHSSASSDGDSAVQPAAAQQRQEASMPALFHWRRR